MEGKSRSFTPWSHVVTLLFAQLSHAPSLNDVCDTLRNHSGVLTTLRRASPPSRNGLSHANRERNADTAESLFCGVLDYLQRRWPRFGMGRAYCGFPRRFRRITNLVGSTTIRLVANCLDWAKHRRRKAAAKCHMRLDLAYVPLRIIAYAGHWGHAFARLFTLLRGVLWECLGLFSLVERCGTATSPPRFRAAPEQAYLPGFGPA